MSNRSILKYLRPHCRENVNDFSCEPPKEKEMNRKFEGDEYDWNFPSETSKQLDAQSQEEEKSRHDIQQSGSLEHKYHEIHGTPSNNELSENVSSSSDLDLTGRKRLLLRNAINDLVSELQLNGEFDPKRHQNKSSLEKFQLNTKQEAHGLIQSINTSPQLVPQQALVFDPSFNKEQLRFVDVLGRGSFGVTVLYEVEHQRKFVGKRLFPRDKGNVIEPNEVLIPLEFTRSELFPSVFGLEWTGQEAIIIQEFAGVSLFHCLRDEQFRERIDKDEHLGPWIMLQIFRGLEMLHKHGVVHRDIKLENICIDSKDRVRIIDFGSARTMQDQYCETYEGSTPEYLPPDVSHNIINRVPPVFRAPLNKAADVWGAGIVGASLCMKGPAMFLYVFGRYPDQWENMDACRHTVQSWLADLKDPLPDGILSQPKYPLMQYLMKHCLRVEEKQRPKAEKVVRFLKGKLNLGEEEQKPKKMTMLNEKDKQRMNSLLKKSDFDNMKVPERSFRVLGIQKDLRDPNVLAAGQQMLNKIFSTAVASPPLAPPPALPQHVVVEKEKLLPNGHAQATVWNVCPSPEYMEVDSDTRQSLEDMDIDGDERPFFDTPQSSSAAIAPSGMRHSDAIIPPWTGPPTGIGLPVQQMWQTSQH